MRPKRGQTLVKPRGSINVKLGGGKLGEIRGVKLREI